ncbi:MAG: UDP-2,3-diacylglucosamine diphosphatase [Bernardetiaceae bacterium]
MTTPETQKRELEVLIISDVHLGTYGSKAKELYRYLKTVHPQRLILNGDILDAWQFSKRYFPPAHLQVIRYIFEMIAQGVEVVYITGNHDEMMRKFVGIDLGRFKIANKVVLDHPNGDKTWVFHGDVFDVTMKHSKWIARLGAYGYGFLMLLNKAVNFGLSAVGRKKISLAKRIKSSVKNAVQSKRNFSETAATLAAYKGYQFVACGHIHQPDIQTIQTAKGQATYLNSGDWMDHLTALEYNHGAWQLYRYHQDPAMGQAAATEKNATCTLSNHQLFEQMLAEFGIAAAKV